MGSPFENRDPGTNDPSTTTTSPASALKSCPNGHVNVDLVSSDSALVFGFDLKPLREANSVADQWRQKCRKNRAVKDLLAAVKLNPARGFIEYGVLLNTLDKVKVVCIVFMRHVAAMTPIFDSLLAACHCICCCL
jgi:hypothetical protein